MNLKISALDFIQEVKTGNISVEDFVAKTIEQIQNVDGWVFIKPPFVLSAQKVLKWFKKWLKEL